MGKSNSNKNKFRKHPGFVNLGSVSNKSSMGVFRREESNQLDLDIFNGSYGLYDVVQPRYIPEELLTLMEMNTYHSKAVKVKAADGSGVGWELLIDGEECDKKESNRVYLDKLFRDQEEGIKDTFYNLFVDKEAVGYGCLEVVRKKMEHGGNIDSIYHVPSKDVRVHRSGDKYIQTYFGKHVWFKKLGYAKDVHKDSGKEYDLGELDKEDRASEMFFITSYSPNDVFYGESDIIPSLSAVMGDYNRQDFVKNFMKTGGVVSNAIVITGDLDDTFVDEDGEEVSVQEELQNMFLVAGQNHSSALAYVIPTNKEGGKVDVSFEKLGDDKQEISFREYRMDNRDEVLSAHGVPAQRLGMSEEGALGGENTKELDDIYESTVVEPLIEIVEDFINNIWLKSLSIKDVDFKIKRREVKNVERKIENVGKLFDMGAVSPNKVIDIFEEEFGLVPSENDRMNGYYVDGFRIDKDLSEEEGVQGEGMEVGLNEGSEKVSNQIDEGIGRWSRLYRRLMRMLKDQ